MKRIAVFLSGVMLAVHLLGSAGFVNAQWEDDYGYDYDYDYDTYDTTEDVATGLGGIGILGGVFGLVIAGCGLIVGVASTVILIISLIHCIQHAPADQKTLWILLILFVPFASLVYFFSKRKQWGPAEIVATA